MMRKNTRVLIVDDLPSTRKMLKFYLAEIGLTSFLEASNGELALKVLSDQLSKGTPIELIFSDWNMPVMSGIEFLERLRLMPEYRETPFIMVTTEDDFSKVKEAVSLGATNYIFKPFKREDVYEKLNQYFKSNETKKTGS